MEITEKRYECTRCGYVGKQNTNHYGETWSWGHHNTCPNCPPWAKYPEFGGQTTWRYMESDNPEIGPTTESCNQGGG